MKIKENWVSWEELNELLETGFTPSGTIDAGTVGGLTAGSIPFASATGFLTQDNAALFWDAAEKNLGIGVNTFGADMTQGIQIATGVAPTANVADSFAFYSADFPAGNACPHFRTEDGTVIGLNQSLLTTDNVIFGTINGAYFSIEATDNYIWSDAIPPGLSGAIGNVLIGKDSGTSITGGDYNVIAGFECGVLLTTGTYNFAAGYRALWREIGGTHNIAIGYRAMYGTAGKSGGGGNVALGQDALRSCYGSGNFGLGATAGQSITTGTFNVCIGSSAGSSMSTAHQNLAIGSYAMQQATGSYNVAIGSYAAKVLTGEYCVAIGRESMRYSTSATNTVAVGRMSCYRNVEGDENVLVGYQCGYGSGAGVDYHDNVGVGAYALFGIGEQGNQNVAIGFKAGYSISTGVGNVCIGYMAGETNLTTDSNELWIANSNTATPLVYGEFPNTLFRIQATNFNVIGTTNLGDGGVTNYASFATDGTLTLHGTAKVLSGQWIDAQAIKAPQTNPAELISHGVLETPAFQFADAIEANQESVTFNMRVPNRMDRSVAPSLLIGWSADGVNPGNCRWQLEYLWTSPGEDTGAAAQETLAATGTAAGVADGLVITEITGIDLPSATDDCLHCRVTRLSADALDTIADTVELHGVCLQFTSDKLGT